MALFNICKESKVYVLCPAGAVTGGPEALHQLAYKLRGKGIDARMVYYSDNSRDTEVPEPYRAYDPVVSDEVEDEQANVVIVPEVSVKIAFSFLKAQRAIWWLSVDNFLAKERREERRKRKGWRKWVFWNRNWNRNRWWRNMSGLSHLAQSAYAKEFLLKHNVSPVFMLTDYLRKDFLSEVWAGEKRHRKNIVVYNPKKGIEITRALSKTRVGSFEWKALENLTSAGVRDLLMEAKIYVDFGHHPGRDRIPREAAMCGCCVISGRRGSAVFKADLPIPEEFKLAEDAPGFLDDANQLIKEVMMDFDTYTRAFDGYREFISKQESVFESEIDKIFF